MNHSLRKIILNFPLCLCCCQYSLPKSGVTPLLSSKTPVSAFSNRFETPKAALLTRPPPKTSSRYEQRLRMRREPREISMSTQPPLTTHPGDCYSDGSRHIIMLVCWMRSYGNWCTIEGISDFALFIRNADGLGFVII